jgi:hypothetical protein
MKGLWSTICRSNRADVIRCAQWLQGPKRKMWRFDSEDAVREAINCLVHPRQTSRLGTDGR